MASRTPPSEALAGWLASQRWFAGKTRRIHDVRAEDVVVLAHGQLMVARVVLDDGTDARYALALPRDGSLEDALDRPDLGRELLGLVATDGAVGGARGRVVGHRTTGDALLPSLGDRADLTVTRLGGEQSNTSLRLDDALILKFFRRLQPGPHPEEEITRFLTERTRFRNSPRLAGHLVYEDGDGESSVLAVVQELVTGARDGWRWLLDALASPAGRRLALPALRRLGERTAELHRALATTSDDPAFVPAPITAADVETWTQAVRRQVDAAARALDGRMGERADVAADAIAAALRPLVGAAKSRHHGDFHLGQTLYRDDGGGDFVIIDFEGEPLRPLAERRQKHTPLRDVAGILRSLDYAVVTAGGPSGDLSGWAADASREYVGGYLAAAADAPFMPRDASGVASAIAVFELEKAAYEVVYEANNRPDWIAIPARGLVSAAARLGSRRAAGAA